MERFGAAAGLRLALSVWLGNRQRRGTPFVIKLPSYAAPVTLRAGTADIGVFRQVIINEQYGFVDLEKPSLILDCGAHIGLTTIYFAHKYPSASIIAVESNPQNYEFLLRNTAAYPRIRCIHGAVWGAPERLAITNPEAETWAFRVAPTDTSQYVQGVTIEGLLAESRAAGIDLLKCDIEGAERVVFESAGAQAWIQRTSVLMAELHDPISPGCSRALYELIRPYPRTQRVQDEIVCVDLRPSEKRI